ncbi:MAG: S1 RNA-binding domain-containing protein [Candidatus Izimaplasma sp.]|nr:S1 RNA-binding domain-containing protein [Candidatus Izimaplasma bacterium]
MKQGSIIKGEITAIKPYGAFVKVDSDYVGLIHISEFSDGFVRGIEDYVTVGDVIDLKILKVANNRLSLSYKALHKKKKRYNIQLGAGFDPLKEKLSEWISNYDLKDGE